MRIEKSVYIIVATFLLYFFWCIHVEITEAVEGAEVPTEGEIVLYDDTSPGSGVPKSSSDAIQTTQPSTIESSKLIKSLPSSKLVSKPNGQLPYTGELVRKSIFIIGVCLVFGVIIFYTLVSCRKNKEKE